MGDRVFMGIDPGTQGGFVCLDDTGLVERVVRFSQFRGKTVKKRAPVLWDAVYREFPASTYFVGMIENVHAMPFNGSIGGFKLGKAAGVAEAFLIANGIPYRRVTPQKWQAEFISPIKGEDSNARKRRLKQAAEVLFPREKIVCEIADAYLIAEYCRRHWAD